MTEHAKKLKGKEAAPRGMPRASRDSERLTPRARGLVSQQHERGATLDPFEDEALDEMLEKALGGTAEPRLVIADRFLTGTRIRREV